MTQSLRIVLRVLNISIVVASIVLMVMGVKDLAGAILSLAIVYLWSPILTMKVAMIRVRARARFLRRPVTRSDTLTALAGSLIVGPILGLLFFAIWGGLTRGH
jgi:hypothetical protein